MQNEFQNNFIIPGFLHPNTTKSSTEDSWLSMKYSSILNSKLSHTEPATKGEGF